LTVSGRARLSDAGSACRLAKGRRREMVADHQGTRPEGGVTLRELRMTPVLPAQYVDLIGLLVEPVHNIPNGIAAEDSV
jgi:hypothetical protein